MNTPEHYSEDFDIITKRIFTSQFYDVFPVSQEYKDTDYEVCNLFYENHFKNSEIAPTGDNNLDLEKIVFHNKAFDISKHAAWISSRVGQGKSSTLCHWMHTREKELIKHKKIVIRFDIEYELLTYKELPTIEDFLIILKTKLTQVVKKYPHENLENLESTLECLSEHHYDGLKNFSDALSDVYNKLGLSVCLIIDNLDALVYKYDRYLFLRDVRSPEVSEYEKLIGDYLRVFLHKHYLSITPGFSLIFVSRDSSKYWLNICEQRITKEAMKNEYTIHNSAESIDVITAHYHLLLEYLNLLKKEEVENQNEYNRIHYSRTHLIKEAIGNLTYYSESDDYQKLYKSLPLCGDGLRGIVVLANFLLLPLSNINRFYGKEAKVCRELLQQHCSTLVMLGQKKLYSQQYSKFPNLFMINTNHYPDDKDHIEAHKPTYWLKILILLYIFEVEKENKVKLKVICNIRLICEVFCVGDYSYSEKLVKLAVGSMFSASESALITTNNPINPNDKEYVTNKLSLVLTERGRDMVDLNAIKTRDGIINVRRCYFHSYVQLLSDDFDLPIPDPFTLKTDKSKKKYEDQVIDCFDYFDHCDYSFILHYSNYPQRVRKMNRVKSKTSSVLYYLLEVSLDIEYRLYKDVLVNRLGNRMNILTGKSKCIKEAYNLALDRGEVIELAEEDKEEISKQVKKFYSNNFTLTKTSILIP